MTNFHGDQAKKIQNGRFSKSGLSGNRKFSFPDAGLLTLRKNRKKCFEIPPCGKTVIFITKGEQDPQIWMPTLDAF